MRTESKAIAFRIGLSGPSEGKQGLQGRMHCLGAGVLLSSPRSCSCMQGVARLQLPTGQNFGLQHEIGPFNRAAVTFELDSNVTADSYFGS